MLKLVREFQNAVERNQWRSVSFTADSENLAAAAYSKTEHIIYIWNREWGNLTRILEGTPPPPPPPPGWLVQEQCSCSVYAPVNGAQLSTQ